ncbi:hypothetical protein [Kutzneria kofuensis]|uniref:Uncharacterized protein n=1 Tax=Kutzneria kofuensis TaxID=103725 RepID=A0A7W9KE94_9PSEU|nr:hypothetical protein [Kutzneria kofuensis]MBB5891015.1 hypothetical protein [Kutzneria kofuensis]
MASVSGVVATAVNERAKRKYGELVTCVEVLVGTLPRVEKHIKAMDKGKKGRTYKMATPDELLKRIGMIRAGLVDFTEECKKRETELTTTEWTV